MHNISILNGDLSEELVDDIEIRNIRDHDEFIANMNEEEGNNAGILKRREIMNILPI